MTAALGIRIQARTSTGDIIYAESVSPRFAAALAELVRPRAPIGMARKSGGWWKRYVPGVLKAIALTITNTRAQALLSDIKTAIDAGTAAIIEIRDGSQPTDADTAVGAQVLLATLTMSATAFGAVSDDTPGAIMTAAAITADSSADATGTASWFRLLTQSAGTVIMDGSVGTSGCDINFNTVSFTAGSQIEITAMTMFIGETDAQ